MRPATVRVLSMNKRRSRSVQATSAGIERLEIERRKRGLTLEALARSANVAPDTLKRLIRRDRVDRNSVRDVVSALDLEPTDIVDFQEWNQWYDPAGADEPKLSDQEEVQTAQLDDAANQAEALLKSPEVTAVSPSSSLEKLSTSLSATSESASPEPLKIEPSAQEPDFSFYIERPALEATCIQTIETAGGLLRIKAPQHMGKTTLLTRLLWQAAQQGYQTVCLSFQLADRAVFADLNTFLKWFCAVVSRELGLSNPIDEWQEILSGSYNATSYFQNHLLSSIDSPLVLALDNTDLVFEHDEIATDFCKLLRNWHDLPRRSDRNSPLWQKLRLVIVHATEIYTALDINASPLAGVGVLVDLPEFTAAQVQDLVRRYGFDWDETIIQPLTHLVGGHPYLLQLGLEQMQRQHVSLDQFLQIAPTEAGIYSNHLRQQLSHLEQSPELIQSFHAIITSEEPIQIKPAHAFKLQSMGLVQLEGNHVKPRCLLYRKYFSNLLK
jgi:lambda repressor-like predicted transcriptional regulator